MKNLFVNEDRETLVISQKPQDSIATNGVDAFCKEHALWDKSGNWDGDLEVIAKSRNKSALSREG